MAGGFSPGASARAACAGGGGAGALACTGATAADGFSAPSDCRYTRRGDRLYLHVFTWPMRHLHLPGMAGKIAYAQLLHDASEVFVTDSDPHARAQNTAMPGFEGVATVELPIQRPDVLVPVVELFLTA